MTSVAQVESVVRMNVTERVESPPPAASWSEGGEEAVLVSPSRLRASAMSAFLLQPASPSPSATDERDETQAEDGFTASVHGRAGSYTAPARSRRPRRARSFPSGLRRTALDLGRALAPPPELGLVRFTRSLLWHDRTHDDPARPWLRELSLEEAAKLV